MKSPLILCLTALSTAVGATTQLKIGLAAGHEPISQPCSAAWIRFPDLRSILRPNRPICCY